MALPRQDIEFIKAHLGEWLAAQSFAEPPAVYEIELIQTIPVQMDKRFDAVERRFEQIQLNMDKRFEELTRRLERFMFWSFGLTVSVSDGQHGRIGGGRHSTVAVTPLV